MIIGSPSVWKPATAPKKVKPDAGVYLRDPARHVFPNFPLEPLFRALCVTRPTMKLNDIDLVTDRRNLRLLLGFVSGSTSSFRIGVDVIKNTMLFSCWTPKAKTYVDRFQGYGYEFEKAYTRRPSDVEDSITHNRAICYTLGDVKMILRYEVDGCIHSNRERHKKLNSSDRDTHTTPTGFTVIGWGKLIDPCRIIEIKTGRLGRSLDNSKNLEQLWFADTPILCTGKYDESGRFTDISEEDCLKSGKLGEWEQNHQQELKRLAALLRLLVDLARTASLTNCALILSEGKLKIFDLVDQNEKGLPADLESLWA